MSQTNCRSKRAALLISLAAALLLPACAGPASPDTSASEEPAARTTSAPAGTPSWESSATPTAAASAPDASASEGLGRRILLTQWGMAFSLPERFDVTDIRVAYMKGDTWEAAAVTSYTLASELDKEMCWGGTLELGSFVEITRYKEPGDDGREQVGDYYYRVDPGPGYDTCWDEATYNNYYAPDVIEAVRSSLEME